MPLAAGDITFQSRFMQMSHVAGHQHRQVLSNEFIGSVPKYLFRSRIGEEDGTALIYRHDHIGRRFGDDTISLFTLGEGLLRPLTFSDVLYCAEHPRLVFEPSTFAVEPSQSLVRMLVPVLEIYLSRSAPLFHMLLDFVPVFRVHTFCPPLVVFRVFCFGPEKAMKLGRKAARVVRRIPLPRPYLGSTLGQEQQLLIFAQHTFSPLTFLGFLMPGDDNSRGVRQDICKLIIT